MGRPRKLPTPEAFKAKADAYFAAVDAYNKTPEGILRPRPLMITSLALALGLSSRQELFDYSTYEGYEDVVAAARARVEEGYEHRLHGTTPTGAIFALKNMGWKDERTIDTKSSDGSMTPKSTATIDTSKLSLDQLAGLYGAIKVGDANNA